MRLSESKLRTAAISDKFLHRTPVSHIRIPCWTRRGNGEPSITSFIILSVVDPSPETDFSLFAFDAFRYNRVSMHEISKNRERLKKVASAVSTVNFKNQQIFSQTSWQSDGKISISIDLPRSRDCSIFD